MENKKNFFEELKSEYDKQFTLKERIEGKAGALLTICGITIPLLFGFSSFLIEKIDPNYYFYPVISILITIGIFSTITSIFYILFLFKTVPYQYVINANNLYKIINNKPDMTMIDKIISKQEEDYLNIRMFNYLKCIKRNTENNLSKSNLLKNAQWIFGIGMVTIPITVGVLLFNIPNIRP